MAVVKTTVYANAADLRAIKRLAKQRGTSGAALIRDALSKLAREGKRPLPRSVGMGHGPSDLAARTEKLFSEGFGRD